MLFEARFHDGIRSGAITVTVRAWKSARVRAGRRYRAPPVGFLHVEAVDEQALGEVSDRDARRAGFGGRDELADYLARGGDRPAASTRVFRVAFHYVGDARDARRERRLEISPAALAESAAVLDSFDRRSRRGPWAWRSLELIGARPRTAARLLAPELGRETRAFKADVRKLKELGLTVSREVGYELSPRGEALLARHRS